jgi:Protein of unknown function (DUF3551)
MRAVDKARHKHWPNARKMAEAVYQGMIGEELEELAARFG